MDEWFNDCVKMISCFFNWLFYFKLQKSMEEMFEDNICIVIS